MNDTPSTEHSPVNDTSLTHLSSSQQMQSIPPISLQMQTQKQNLKDTIVFIFPKPLFGKSTAKLIKFIISTTISQWIPRTIASIDKKSRNKMNLAEIINNDENIFTFYTFATMSIFTPESLSFIPETYQQIMALPNQNK